MRLSWQPILLATLVACAPCGVSARPFTVEDMLQMESFGQTVVDPTGRLLLFEKRDPYGSGRRFDNDWYNDVAVSRLYVADLVHPGPAHPLIPASAGKGFLLGPLSPDGRRVVVLQLAQHKLEAGVVTLATGHLRRLHLSPEDGTTARVIQWLSPTRILMITRPDGRAPNLYRHTWDGPDQQPNRWAANAVGKGRPTAYGSGAWRTARPPSLVRRLTEVDALSGKARTLAEGAFADLEISPDHQRAALLEYGEDIQPRAGEPAQGPFGLAHRERRLAVLDLATGDLHHPGRDWDLLDTLLSWRPDSGGLVVFARRPGAPWPEGGLRLFTPGSDQLEALDTRGVDPDLKLRPERVQVSWLGRDLLVYGTPRRTAGTPRSDWFRITPGGAVNLTGAFRRPPAGGLTQTGDSLVFVADGATWQTTGVGSPRRLSGRELDPWPGVRATLSTRLALEPAVQAWTLGLAPGDSPRLIRVGADGATREISLGSDDQVLAWSDEAAAAVTLNRDARQRAWLSVVTASGRTRIATINEHLADVDAPRIIALHHKGPDGQALTSWLFLPARPTGGPPPLIVRPYLGHVPPAPRLEDSVTGSLAQNIDVMVGQGYAVLYPSLPKPRTGDFVDGLADRLLAIVDAAAARPDLSGAFDPQRLALWGHSYGAYTVCLAIAQTDRFKAAIASGTPADLISVWGTFQTSWRNSPEEGVMGAWPEHWTEAVQGGMGAPPYAAPERYVHASPIFGAAKITTPLLIFHGDQDSLSLNQPEEMFSALYRQNKDALLVTYWGEGHMLASPGTVRDRYARSFAWLAHYLGPPSGRSVPPTSPATGGPTPPSQVGPAS